jgi:hypothetical protein
MRLSKVLIVSVAAALFAGCADYSVGYYGPGPVADIEYDGYYDGYYGQIYDGYWGDNGVFFYRTGEGGRWSRGDTTHFRRDAAPGFNHIHGTARAAPQHNQKPG